MSAVFVDYDNIYMSLKRKNEEAARRFAKEAATWIKGIESGALITPTNGIATDVNRRIIMNRCYGNPVPRRNQSDNSTDMSSFPFVRHHFLRAGFEVVDCPPLTAQLKNSSDIRMVMDIIDFLAHGTYFDEFIILSGDADFTPVLHRLRAHARRTIIFANDYTAAPYTAISDGEVREADLIDLLLEGRGETGLPAPAARPSSEIDVDAVRQEILAEVAAVVRASPAPVPLEVLADRAVRAIGHDKTVATSWAGTGGFRDLLNQGLPEGLRLSDQPPYLVIDTRRHLIAQPAAAVPELRARAPEARPERTLAAPTALPQQAAAPAVHQPAHAPTSRAPAPEQSARVSRPAVTAAPQHVEPALPVISQAPIARAPMPPTQYTEPAAPAPAPSARTGEPSSSIQQSIARIHDACQAPPLSPTEYRAVFEVIALEINENGLVGAQTIQNIVNRCQERGIDMRRDDARFILDVVSETDPWFEQGASINLFAGRFRNFVVARCRSQGLHLSADELDLIEAWFAGNGAPGAAAGAHRATQAAPSPAPSAGSADPRLPMGNWPSDEGRAAEPRPARAGGITGQSLLQPARAQAAQQTPTLNRGDDLRGPDDLGDEFPRIVRTRLRS